MASQRTFEDLNLSKDEVKRLGDALKDENFRKLLVEYAEEISDPENRRKAEEEIAMMENERGMNVQFVRPEPGYVIKTTVNGTQKTFINICQNDKIGKPSAKRQVGADGKSGMMWQIPHSFAPPKDDHDKDKKKCQVFDVVFHPDTYRMSMTNERFRKIVEDTALDGIEKQFNITVDKKNIKHPKMKFKGVQTATVIRERIEDAVHKPKDQDDVLNNFPYPYDNKTSSEKAKENEMKNERNSMQNGKSKSGESAFTEPKYSIIHRSDVDMSEYRNAPDAKTSTRPNQLVIKIELPLLKSAAQANLDIFEKKLLLESVSPAAYKLELALPFPVNDNEGTAKFDKSKRTLTVTLPVLPDKTPELPFAQHTETNSSEANTNEKAAPLIEVLSESLKTNGSHKNSNSQLLDNATVNGTPENVSVTNRENDHCKTTFPQSVKWVLPSYQFSQDNETVSFVIQVQNVEEKATQMIFPQSSKAVLQFMSVGSGCFPVYYSLFVEFPDGCDISSDHCSIDVSHDNLVFIILKDKTCRGLWETFKIGIDDTQLEEKQFLTEGNLQKELSDLDKEALEASMPLQEETTAQLSVVEMNEKKLTIDIKPPKGKYNKSEEEDDDDTDAPSSAEIEVVHKHPTPNLHSILKARSVSESSEDFNHRDPESPRSEGEELSSSFGKRRSVSFSNHIDHASFKASASVSSMTPALKSKRRRQRKRDERRKAKVRRNSEGSSGDDNLHSVSDSHSHSEEEGDAVDKSKGEKRTVLARAMSDPGPGSSLSVIIDEEDERTKASGDQGKKKRGKKQGKAEGSIAQCKDGLDFRTNQVYDGSQIQDGNSGKENSAVSAQKQNVVGDDGESGGNGEKDQNGVRVEKGKGHGKNKVDGNKKIISEIKNKLSGGGDTGGDVEDSDDDNFVDAVSSLNEDFNSKLKMQESVQSHGGKQVGFAPGKDVNDSKGDSSGCESKGNSGDASNDKSDVETMLSWNENQQRGGEHVTQCEFQFSNSVMFDLDVD